MDSLVINLEGFDELDRKLSQLEPRVAKGIVRTAVRDGSKMVQKQAIANVIGSLGGALGAAIARYLVLRVWTRPPAFVYGIAVNVSSKGNDEFIYHAKKHSRYRNMKTYIPQAIESGHIVGRTFVAPIPFIQPAYDTTKYPAAETIMREIDAGVQAEFEK